MKKLLVLLIPITLLLFTSCGSDDEQQQPSFEVDCTYLKIQEGSKITNKWESNGTVQTISSEVISQETIDGVLLAVFETDGAGGGQSYLTCEGEKMISSAPAASTNTNGATTTTSAIILTYDLGAPIGQMDDVATITSTVEVQGQTFTTTNRYVGSVVEKNITMDVEGTSYTDVVKYQLDTYTESSTLPGEEFHFAATTYYFAPEVATIYTEITDPFSGAILSKVSLVSFEY